LATSLDFRSDLPARYVDDCHYFHEEEEGGRGRGLSGSGNHNKMEMDFSLEDQTGYGNHNDLSQAHVLVVGPSGRGNHDLDHAYV
jgi:hypothetical protein